MFIILPFRDFIFEFLSVAKRKLYFSIQYVLQNVFIWLSTLVGQNEIRDRIVKCLLTLSSFASFCVVYDVLIIRIRFTVLFQTYSIELKLQWYLILVSVFLMKINMHVPLNIELVVYIVNDAEKLFCSRLPKLIR